MVSVTTMLLGLASTSALAHASSSDLPTYTIPSFNYATLDDAEQATDILGALKADGIVALNNVPNYEALRQKFLAKATECALAGVSNPGEDSMYVSSKRFDDNTKRYTISTNAGLELPNAADDVEAKCPGYRALYQEFSATVERAVNNFGAALDKTSFTASDGQQVISSRKLVSEAVRLDHFHAYEAAQQQTPSERRLSMSLPLHEDHGLFIAMSAPKFFEVTPAGQLHERRLANDASGLIIQTGNGQRVRPVLKEDEVVIMMGTGASRWLKTSERIPAVMHGMKMPENLVASGSRELRAWFGKMTLLPSYQRLLEDEHTVFDAHVNRTTRYLLQEEPEAKFIGCATGRRLTPSEGKCTLQRCTVKPGKTDPGDGCQTICNRENHDPEDAPNCKASCDCTPVSGPAERCWMLCVANLPDSECPMSSQTCKDQSIICKATPTPAPTTAPPTTAPPTTAPPTTAPPTTEPPTTAPAPGPAPTTTAPAPGPAPTTTAPAPGPAPTTTAPAPGPAPTTTAPAPGATTKAPAPGPAPTTTAPAPGATTKAPAPGATTKAPAPGPASTSAKPAYPTPSHLQC